MLRKNIEQTPLSLLANMELVSILLIILAILYLMLSPVLDRASQQGIHQLQNEPAAATELD